MSELYIISRLYQSLVNLQKANYFPSLELISRLGVILVTINS